MNRLGPGAVNRTDAGGAMLRVLIAGAALVVVAFLMVGCGQVGPGERAVFVRWGVIDQKCYEPGLYFYNPISTSMDTLDVKTRKYEVEKLAAASQDLQEIHADVVVNYAIDSGSCHQLLTTVG
jgi:regulator of protease activity HflC (stomatin/prohibitin superfamily)